jgi:PAS domain S-box-containing protein
MDDMDDMDYRATALSTRPVEGDQAASEISEAILANTSRAILVVGADGRLTFANRAAGQGLGVAVGQSIAREVLNLIHQDDRNLALDLFPTADPTSSAMFRMRLGDGEWRHVHVVCTNCLDHPLINGYVLDGEDVTDRVTAAKSLHTLRLTNEALVHAADEEGLVNAACRTIVEAGGYPLAWVGLARRDEAQTFDVVGAAGRTRYLDEISVSWGSQPSGEGPAGRAMRTGKIQVIRDVRSVKCFAPWRQQAERHGLRAACAIPLNAGDGVIGVLLVYSGQVGAFDEDAVALLAEVAANLAYGIGRLGEGRLLQASMSNMIDGLISTGRDGLIRYANPAASRLLGYGVEELIGQQAHELYHYRHPDGSPYPVELCPVSASNAGAEVFEVDRDEFYRKDGSALPVAYSVSPLRSATGRREGMVMVFRDISAQIAEELRAEQERDRMRCVLRIEDAFDEDRFVLYAQPIVDVKCERIVRYELLLRMIGRDGEVIAPGAFLPAAEEYGLIGRIDRWVVTQAAELAAASGQVLHFNVSAKSVGDEALLHALGSAIVSTGAPADHLVCEITETAFIQDAAAAERFVRELRDIGCKVALDDFGAGYGGFTYLKNLPVSTLKIDIRFVQDVHESEQSRLVIEAVVSIARAFGLETIAEGAEDPEALAALAALGVDYVQGYAVAHPEPIASTAVGATGLRAERRAGLRQPGVSARRVAAPG